MESSERSKITYDDILRKMGMCVVNGELQQISSGHTSSEVSSETKEVHTQPHHSYIHTKYAKQWGKINHTTAQNNVIPIHTKQDYIRELARIILQNHNARQVKSKKISFYSHGMSNNAVHIVGKPRDILFPIK